MTKSAKVLTRSCLSAWECFSGKRGGEDRRIPAPPDPAFGAYIYKNPTPPFFPVSLPAADSALLPRTTLRHDLCFQGPSSGNKQFTSTTYLVCDFVVQLVFTSGLFLFIRLLYIYSSHLADLVPYSWPICRHLFLSHVFCCY